MRIRFGQAKVTMMVRALFLLLLFGCRHLYAQEPPPSSTAPAGAQITYSMVKSEELEARLKRFSRKNEVRMATTQQLLEESGCGGNIVLQPIALAKKMPNVICTLPGSTDSVIVVGAHYDKTESGEGVIDNWTGTVLMTALYRGLRDSPRRHTFVFIGFGAEERGLLGSREYVQQLGDERRAKIVAMVNLDSLGLSPTKAETNHGDKRLLEILAVVSNAVQIPVSGMNVDKIGSTDSESFRAKNIPTISLHSLTQETWPWLHSYKDRYKSVNLDHLTDTYKIVAAYLSAMDQMLPLPTPAVDGK
jgi:Zn-dependent M28 family amino/carboxypeptidase